MVDGLEVMQVPPEAVIDVRHAVLRPGRPRDTAFFAGDTEPDTRHWAICAGGSPVGVLTVLTSAWPDGPLSDGDVPLLQLRGMAVLDAWQGRGVGGLLIEHVQAAIGEDLWCNARERAIPFYARHGWVVASEVFPIAGIGPHRRMVWRAGASSRRRQSPTTP